MTTPPSNFDVNRADGVRAERGEGRQSVLLVAAQERTLQSCASRLGEAGFHVAMARTGFEAIVKASCQLPDIIVMEDGLLAGEGVDGDSARELIAYCPATSHIPIVPCSDLAAIEADAARVAELLNLVQTGLARR